MKNYMVIATIALALCCASSYAQTPVQTKKEIRVQKKAVRHEQRLHRKEQKIAAQAIAKQNAKLVVYKNVSIGSR
jgi:hypothetical protein